MYIFNQIFNNIKIWTLPTFTLCLWELNKSILVAWIDKTAEFRLSEWNENTEE